MLVNAKGREGPSRARGSSGWKGESGAARRRGGEVVRWERHDDRARHAIEIDCRLLFLCHSRPNEKKTCDAPLCSSPALSRSRGLDRRLERRFATAHRGGKQRKRTPKNENKKQKKVKKQKVRAKAEARARRERKLSSLSVDVSLHASVRSRLVHQSFPALQGSFTRDLA